MIELNNYIIILIFGSLVLLSLILIANPLRVNKKANFYFGLFLALWSSYWIEEVFFMSGIQSLGKFSNSGLLLLQSFTPILFYLSVVYYAKPDFQIRLRDMAYLVVPLVVLVEIVLDSIMKTSFLSLGMVALLIISQSLFFILLSYFRIKKHKAKVNLFNSNTERINLNWLEIIIFALLALCIFMGLYNLISNAANLNIIANTFVLFIIYFIGYHTIQQTEIFTISKEERALVIETIENVNNSRKKLVSDKELDSLMKRLRELMKTQQPYLNPELKIEELAQSMGITPHHLSYVINVGYGENFFQFINKYRIAKVKELLLTEKYNKLSIMGIAYESGFNSKTSFNTTFKKFTQQTPSEFRKSGSDS